jgi:hypothetical protein
MIAPERDPLYRWLRTATETAQRMLCKEQSFSSGLLAHRIDFT